MDTFTKSKRSSIMRAVRSRGNRSTELKFKEALKKARIKNWRSNPILKYNPDFAFYKERVAVFIDGCFWHGCKNHLRIPKSNVSYWKKKIDNNKRRDKIANRSLKGEGWKVFRIWEHTVNKEKTLFKRLEALKAVLHA